MAWIGGILGLILAFALGLKQAAVIFIPLGAGLLHYAGAGFRKSNERDSVSSLKEDIAALRAELKLQGARLARLEAYSSRPAVDSAKAAPEVPAEPVKTEPPKAAPASTVPVTAVAAPMTVPVAPAPPKPQAIPETMPAAASAAASVPPQAQAPAPAPAMAQEKVAVPPVQTPPKAAPRRPSPPPRPPEPSYAEIMFKKFIFGGNTVVKIGVLILFLGLAFLLRYAAENNMLPRELRFAAVAAAGVGLLAFGWRLRQRSDSYGLILQGAGTGVLYLVTLAATKDPILIAPGAGLMILIGVAAFAAMCAVLQDSLALAVVAALGGFAAPVLVSTGHPNHVALFSYLTVLNLGIVGIAWFKAWRPLNLLGYVCSFALFSGWMSKYYETNLFSTTEPFVLGLFFMYVVITFLFARRTLHDAAVAADEESGSYGDRMRAAMGRISYVDGTLAFGVPLSIFGMQYALTKQWEFGAAFSALGFGAFYLLMALFSLRRAGARYLLLNEALVALGVVFASLAVPLGLEARWTSAVWAVEAAGVFWMGVRQQRWPARFFSLLLAGGAIVSYLMGLEPGGADTVVHGSALGALLLALSAWSIYYQIRRASFPPGQLETVARPLVTAAGAAFVALIPFLVWPMDWAAPALAVLGAAGAWFALRLSERGIAVWSWAYQALAGLLFFTTMHQGTGGAVLERGWGGLAAAMLIGASLLASARAGVVKGEGSADSAPEQFGPGNVALLAGLVFLNLAPLFLLPMRYAALLWPVAGIATLWWAVRRNNTGAIVFGVALQLFAGLFHVYARLNVASEAPLDTAHAFAHTGFWGPVLLTFAAFFCARQLQRGFDKTLAMSHPFGPVALLWAAIWWLLAWHDELTRVLDQGDALSAQVVVLVASMAVADVLANVWRWRQLGAATLAYLPLLSFIAAAFTLGREHHPLVEWGIAAWPLALMFHGWLLMRQKRWVSDGALSLAHVAGAWLFLLLAAIELRWWFAHYTVEGSAWDMLGWMIAPVAFLWAVSSGAVSRRWPVRDFDNAYRLGAGVPVVMYLLLWVWVGNGVSDGAAAPLPFIPLLNPLELAQLAVVMGVLLWWRSLAGHDFVGQNRTAAKFTVGLTLLAILTGSVLRAVHHWAGVPWALDDLLASNLAQTALSVTWGTVAIGLMLAGNRRKGRGMWITGAVLIAVVVAKLFLVELSQSGSLTRIVSFIVVGMLLLLVGFFAPLPPRAQQVEGVAA